MSDYNTQTARFLAAIATCMPEISSDVMQGWIESPKALQKALREAFCPPTKYVIDCDADPFLPEGWKVESHKKGGRLEWDPASIRLHLSPNQQSLQYIVGNELQKELENQPVLNANVLDYLLAHQELILKEWRSKCVFFWGTIYCDPDGYLRVRYLVWSGEHWSWNFRRVAFDFYGDCPAVCSQVSS